MHSVTLASLRGLYSNNLKLTKQNIAKLRNPRQLAGGKLGQGFWSRSKQEIAGLGLGTTGLQVLMLLWPLIHSAFKTPSPKFQEEDTCLLLKIRIFFAPRERFTNTQWSCFLVFHCRLCTSRGYQLGFFLLYLMLKFLLTPFQQHSCFMRWGRTLFDSFFHSNFCG